MTTLSLIPLGVESYVLKKDTSLDLVSDTEKKIEEMRSGEESKTWFRSDRLYEDNGVWFFATREKIDVGPYTSLGEAEIDIQVLIASLKDTKSEEDAIQVIRAFSNRERLRLL